MAWVLAAMALIRQQRPTTIGQVCPEKDQQFSGVAAPKIPVKISSFPQKHQVRCACAPQQSGTDAPLVGEVRQGRRVLWNEPPSVSAI